MIATLTGTVTEKLHDAVIVDVLGVGYGVTMAVPIIDGLQIGTEAKVYIYEQIKEDAHTLYGFLSLEDKKLFEQLLRVKNVGPKVAIAVLAIGNSAAVRAAIAGGDVSMLQTAKGVGKRAAEQIIVELRDKMGMIAAADAEAIVNRAGEGALDEAAQALVALGYSESDAHYALQDIDTDLPLEDRIKQALTGRR